MEFNITHSGPNSELDSADVYVLIDTFFAAPVTAFLLENGAKYVEFLESEKEMMKFLQRENQGFGVTLNETNEQRIVQALPTQLEEVDIGGRPVGFWNDKIFKTIQKIDGESEGILEPYEDSEILLATINNFESVSHTIASQNKDVKLVSYSRVDRLLAKSIKNNVRARRGADPFERRRINIKRSLRENFVNYLMFSKRLLNNFKRTTISSHDLEWMSIFNLYSITPTRNQRTKFVVPLQ